MPVVSLLVRYLPPPFWECCNAEGGGSFVARGLTAPGYRAYIVESLAAARSNAPWVVDGQPLLRADASENAAPLRLRVVLEVPGETPQERTAEVRAGRRTRVAFAQP